MRTRLCLVVSILLLAVSGSDSFGQASGGLHDALAAKGFDEVWIRSFGQRWDALQARLRLPQATLDVVLALLEPEWIPEDPGEAAGAVHEATREAEIRRRRGEPLWELATRLEHALRRRAPAAGSAAKEIGRDGAAGTGRLEQWRSDRLKAEPGAGSPRIRPGPGAQVGDAREIGGEAGTAAGGDPPGTASAGDKPTGGAQGEPGGSGAPAAGVGADDAGGSGTAAGGAHPPHSGGGGP
jgi:hypothetical protein